MPVLAMSGNQHLVIPKAGEHQHHQKSDNNSFYNFWIHKFYEKLFAFLAKNKPNDSKKGYYSSNDVKVEKGHDFMFIFSAFVAAAFAIIKKAVIRGWISHLISLIYQSIGNDVNPG